MKTKALSIRQPWAWLIANGFKDIENRSWNYPPKYKGPLYIHAAKGCTKAEYEAARDFAYSIDPSITIPPLAELDRGGLVAVANLTGYVKTSESPWFMGSLGLELSEVRKIEFIKYKGQLGFFTPKIDTSESLKHRKKANPYALTHLCGNED